MTMTGCDALMVPGAVLAALLMAVGAVALLALAGWVLGRVAPPPAPRHASTDLLPEALLYAAAEEAGRVEHLDVSGEYKRHAVLARLIERCPGHAKRDLAFAIELVLR